MVEREVANTSFTVRRPRPLPVLVLADVSGSMSENGKVETLNAALASMFKRFAAERGPQAEIHVAVITFGGDGARLHHPLRPASETAWEPLRASGRTPLGAALELAATLLGDETVLPAHALPPTIVLVSDGIPTDAWEAPLERLTAAREGRTTRLAVAVGAEVDALDHQMLQRFVGDAAFPVARAAEADRLVDFFTVVTTSVTVRQRNPTAEPFAAFDVDALRALAE